MRTKSRVLIVEDNIIAAKVLANHCLEARFAVDHATGVGLASEFLLQYTYRLILMDLGLPDGDGKSLTQWIRTNDNPNRDTPIIVISAHMNEALKRACLAAGANEVLVKPVLPLAMAQLLKESQ